MENYRLKNIAIVLLLLLNGFLLLLVGYQHFQSGRTERETAQRLQELCSASQLTLDSGLDLACQPLPALSLSRRADTEQAMAACLLGSRPTASSQGGGIYSYEAEAGSIQFRAGGSFYGSGIAVPVEDISAFCQDFFHQFGYEDAHFQTENGTGTATASQKVGGVEVTGSGVALSFENGVLISVTGSHVSLESASPEAGGAEMSCITALVRFLDYRNASGAVCSEVRDVRCVYQLQGAASPRLLPVWQIETDTNTYFVNCQTGEITGK